MRDDRSRVWSKNKQVDQWIGVTFFIIAIIVTNATRSGGKPATQSYIESQKQEVSRVADNQFCLSFAKSISGTVEYKENLYQDCVGN